MQVFDRQIGKKQLYYHNREHIQQVQQRSDRIFQAIAPFWENAISSKLDLLQKPISVYEILDAEIDDIRFLKLKCQPDFEQALDDYRQGNFEEAKVYLEKVLSVNSNDKTADLYLSRVNYLLESDKTLEILRD